MLSAVNKGNSSLNVNSGFPHLTNTQQLQQSGTFTISCQMTVIFLVSQNQTRLNRSRVAIFCATATNSHSVAIGTLKKSGAHAFCASLWAFCLL